MSLSILSVDWCHFYPSSLEYCFHYLSLLYIFIIALKAKTCRVYPSMSFPNSLLNINPGEFFSCLSFGQYSKSAELWARPLGAGIFGESLSLNHNWAIFMGEYAVRPMGTDTPMRFSCFRYCPSSTTLSFLVEKTLSTKTWMGFLH